MKRAQLLVSACTTPSRANRRLNSRLTFISPVASPLTVFVRMPLGRDPRHNVPGIVDPYEQQQY